MAIKDKIVKWFIENIVIPQQEIIDQPGFIVEAYNKAGQEVFLREVFFPESIIIQLEKQIVSKFGIHGKQALYSAGKKFGYSYAARSYFPQVTTVNPKEFEDFVYMWIRYVEATYGKIDYVFHKEQDTIILKLDEFIVCPKNGLGYFMPSGSFAGFWAYLIDNYSVECVQTKCSGQGNEHCELIAGPVNALKNNLSEIIISKKLPISWNAELARSINSIRPCRFNNNSFKDLLDSKFFTYDNDMLISEKKRYFLLESSALYFLEIELSKIDSSNKILFDTGFEFGKSIAEKNETNYDRLISMYMSGIGYGDTLIFTKHGKFHVISNYFPWTPYVKKVTFSGYRGIISGLLSKFIGKTILLKKFNYDLSNGFLKIEASE